MSIKYVSTYICVNSSPQNSRLQFQRHLNDWEKKGPYPTTFSQLKRHQPKQPQSALKVARCCGRIDETLSLSGVLVPNDIGDDKSNGNYGWEVR